MVDNNVNCSSHETIIYVDERVNSIYQCPICQQIFRDPVVAQCGVSYFSKDEHTFVLFFFFFSIHSVEIVYHQPVCSFSCLCWHQLNPFVLVPCPYDQMNSQTFVNNHLISQQLNSLLVCCKYAMKGNHRDESGCPVRIPLMKKKSVEWSLSLFIISNVRLSSREHEDECIYRFIPCPNGCSQMNLRQKVSRRLNIFRLKFSNKVLGKTKRFLGYLQSSIYLFESSE